jgi:hypothetical protein
VEELPFDDEEEGEEEEWIISQPLQPLHQYEKQQKREINRNSEVIIWNTKHKTTES